jgi:nucleoside-diphosphate-sugar epimerase
LFHQSYGWPIVRVRPFNAYGPAQSPDRVVPEIIGRGLRRQELKMTKGDQTREFNYVEDLADGFVQVATTPGIDGELFNLGGGEEVSIRDLATKILDLMGNPVVPEFGAMPERPTEIMRMHCDNSKVRERVGWAPSTSLDTGLARTIEWFSEALQRPGSSFAP